MLFLKEEKSHSKWFKSKHMPLVPELRWVRQGGPCILGQPGTQGKTLRKRMRDVGGERLETVLPGRTVWDAGARGVWYHIQQGP